MLISRLQKNDAWTFHHITVSKESTYGVINNKVLMKLTTMTNNNNTLLQHYVYVSSNHALQYISKTLSIFGRQGLVVKAMLQ